MYWIAHRKVSKSIREIPEDIVYVIGNNRLVNLSDNLHAGVNYHVVPRIFGGKGGFGSMLRAIGAQIEKTTNREACRDLSGRRMRDVNNEQQLREWVKDKATREREKEEKRKERAVKRKQALTDTRHNFDDRDYFDQKMQVLEELDDALMQGLQKTQSTTSASAAEGSSKGSKSRKRKHKDPGPDAIKKACEWLGVDMVNMSDLSSDSDSDGETGSDGGEGTSASGSAYKATDARSLDSADLPGRSCDKASEASSQHTSKEEPEKDNPEKSPDKSSPSTDKGKGKGKKSGLLGVLSTLPPTDTTSTSSETGAQKSESAEKESKGDSKEDLSSGDTAAKVQQSQTDPMEPVDLDTFESVSPLEELGLERLKQALMTRGLKCGGTLQQRAERLFAVKGKTKDQIDPSLFAKPARKKNK